LLWRELGSYLVRQRIHVKGTCLALYHGGETKDCDWDIEVCQQIDEDLVPTDRIKVYSLPGIETMACVIHAGALVKIGAAYNAIQAGWLRISIRSWAPAVKSVSVQHTRMATRTTRTR
jgi:effector-binding domain-containing protein